METILRDANRNRYEPDVVRALLHCLSLFPVGCLVRLSTDEVARVIHSNGEAFAKPVVAVVQDKDGNPCDPPRTIDFLQEDDVRIVGAVEEDLGIDETAGL